MKQRIDYLDGLRGVAAIAVLVQHCAETVVRSAAAPAPVLAVIRITVFEGCNLGRFGIALFFLISGMVIPFSFREPQPLRRFAVSRFFRLYPTYWLSIAVALAVYATVGEQLPSVPAFFANLTMAQRFIGFPDIVGAYWTLAIELAFYLLCASIFAAGGLHAPRVLAAAALLMLAGSVALAVLSALFHRHVPANLLVNLSLMFTGTLIRRGWLEGDRAARRLGIVTTALWLAGVALVQFMVVAEDATAPGVAPHALLTGYYGAFTVFAFVLLRRPRFGPAILWLGAVSYSVYLFHGPMLVAFDSVAQPGLAWSGLAFFALVLGSTLLLSQGVWHLVERPMIRCGHAVSSALAQPR